MNHIIHEMQQLFLQQTQALAVCSGFCQRTSPITASAWVQGLVFGWLDQPHATVAALARALAVAGAPVSPQAVQQRFTPQGAALLLRVLERMTPYALQEVAYQSLNRQERSWLEVFPALWLRDSTTIPLPAAMHETWPGTGKAATSPARTAGVGRQFVPGDVPGIIGLQHFDRGPHQLAAADPR